MNFELMLVVAVVLMASRLPSYMTRMSMSRSEKLMFVAISFFVLAIVGFVWLYMLGKIS